jgi:hypothetical protein
MNERVGPAVPRWFRIANSSYLQQPLDCTAEPRRTTSAHTSQRVQGCLLPWHGLCVRASVKLAWMLRVGTSLELAHTHRPASSPVSDDARCTPSSSSSLLGISFLSLVAAQPSHCCVRPQEPVCARKPSDPGRLPTPTPPQSNDTVKPHSHKSGSFAAQHTVLRSFAPFVWGAQSHLSLCLLASAYAARLRRAAAASSGSQVGTVPVERPLNFSMSRNNGNVTCERQALGSPRRVLRRTHNTRRVARGHAVGLRRSVGHRRRTIAALTGAIDAHGFDEQRRRNGVSRCAAQEALPKAARQALAWEQRCG